jgi:hypothetical protein
LVERKVLIKTAVAQGLTSNQQFWFTAKSPLRNFHKEANSPRGFFCFALPIFLAPLGSDRGSRRISPYDRTF